MRDDLDLDRLISLADRLAMVGYRDDGEPYDSDAATEARLDLDALQFAIAIMRDRARIGGQGYRLDRLPS